MGISGIVDKIIDPSVHLMCFFSHLFDIGGGRRDIESHDVRTGLLQVLKLGNVPRGGDDLVASLDRLECELLTKATRRAGDEPYFRSGHFWAIDCLGG